MELLTLAYAAGWEDAAHMKKDADLDPSREREDFEKLLAELEKKFPPPKEQSPQGRGCCSPATNSDSTTDLPRGKHATQLFPK